MRSFLGAVVATCALGLWGLGCGSSVPVHPACQTNANCPSGDACHIPEGEPQGFCVVTCTGPSGCPSAEPQCVADSNGTSPFDFCACVDIGVDGGVPSKGCGAINGYSCNVQAQICSPD